MPPFILELTSGRLSSWLSKV